MNGQLQSTLMNYSGGETELFLSKHQIFEIQQYLEVSEFVFKK